MLPTLPIPSPPHHATTARRVALILAAFTCIVGAMLVFNGWWLQRANPLDHPELMAMKKQLRSEPGNETLIDSYRRLDAELRGRYFQSQRDYATGGWLLLAGVALALLAAHWHRPEARPPTLAELRAHPTPPRVRQAPAIRYALSGTGLTIAMLAVVLAIAWRGELRELDRARIALADEVDQPYTPATIDPPDAADGIGDQSGLNTAQQWPGFRGPHGTGRAFDDDAITWPVQWETDSGRNILWRAPIDLPGHNSPVVWGDRLFITGADQRSRKIYAFDVRDGLPLWEHRVPVLPGGGAWPPEILPHTGFAAPTCATDGRLVFAIFANGDLIACDMQGRRVWAKPLGEAENIYGYASSLAVHNGRLFVQWDHHNVNRILALDAASGDEIWTIEHDAGASWASPMVVQTADRMQLIITSHRATIAYDPADGRELWRWNGPEGDIASSPVADDSRVLVISPAWEMYALPTTETGPLDDDRLLWTFEDHQPEIASPIIIGDLAIVLSDGGRLTAIDMADGRERWHHRLQGRFEASPASAGTLVYVTNVDGLTTVLDVSGNPPQVVGKGELGEPTRASPALLGGRLYMRTGKAVHAIGGKEHD
ncbi:MAG: PQQ-like beta-propeller repeat protein [Phycisphaeraceae bacterium]|nr:PQQ-like beta-propeller repeat protein [Phycisphaeraceae bacterium]